MSVSRYNIIWLCDSLNLGCLRNKLNMHKSTSSDYQMISLCEQMGSQKLIFVVKSSLSSLWPETTVCEKSQRGHLLPRASKVPFDHNPVILSTFLNVLVFEHKELCWPPTSNSLTVNL